MKKTKNKLYKQKRAKRIFINKLKRKFSIKVKRERIINSSNVSHKYFKVKESVIVVKHDLKYLLSINNLKKWESKNINTNKIEFPALCEFEAELNNAERIIGDLLGMFLSEKQNKYILDFSKTEKMSQEFAMLISSILYYYRMDERALNQKLRKTRFYTEIEVIDSLNEQVNKEIFMMGITAQLSVDSDKSTMHPSNSTGLIVNDSQKRDLFKNEKGRTAKKIVNLVNNSLIQLGFEIRKEKESSIQLMISEILDNCEQHSVLRHYFCMANFMTQLHETNEEEKIGELNIVFMNLGYGFYEGFEKNKEKNQINYNEVINFVDYINQQKELDKNKFENQTIYGILQFGNSRLKYKDESRGNGTVNFIKTFSELGDFEDILRNFVPKMYILTGKTIVKICNRNQPIELSGKPFLPLHSKGAEKWNSETEEEFLKTGSNDFPGTILSARLYLNKSHILSKITNEKK